MKCRELIKRARTNEQWIQDLQDKDPACQQAAFTELGNYLHCHLVNDIRRRASKLVSLMALDVVELQSVADDVVQLTLERIHFKLHQYTPTASFLNYALTIARNLLIDTLRRKHWSSETPASLDAPSGEDSSLFYTLPNLELIADSHMDLEANLGWREMVEIVYDTILNDLSENQAVAFIHFYFQNMSSQEIAEQMGKSYIGVDQLRYQARVKIKARLKEKGYTETEFL